jgi:hypothetical protein
MKFQSLHLVHTKKPLQQVLCTMAMAYKKATYKVRLKEQRLLQLPNQ